jgi:8-oxo-dGTP pyrophosphatase MutT (NUDIX family)
VDPEHTAQTQLTEIAAGLLRLAWSAELQKEGIAPTADAVRAALAEAFAEGARRVEVHLDPEDAEAQRIATFSGLLKEGVARGVHEAGDRVVYARVAEDDRVEEGVGFRRLLNSFLPRKRAISQLLVRDPEGRVLLCQLTYKRDWDLPGGVVEVGESPHLAVTREIEEELGLVLPAGPLVLTDWLPPWSGWDDAVCLVFDGAVQQSGLLDAAVYDRREIRSARFCDLDEVHELCADFTARRIVAALATLEANGPSYTESGRAPA